MKERWRARQELVEHALQAELDRTDVLDDTLRQAMAYSLMAGGKRLRPVLLMAAADAVGADGAKFLSVACALEMIHTYSLIHDDLPAMDNDDYRRGKLTNHKVFGDGIAILAGDGLLTLAFTVILRQQDVSADTLLRVVDEISRAAGAEGMVGGQVLDLRAEEHRISMEEMRRVHMGKPVGSDEKNHKSTYVSLTSLEEAQELAAQTVKDACAALRDFGTEADFLRELVSYLVYRKQ